MLDNDVIQVEQDANGSMKQHNVSDWMSALYFSTFMSILQIDTKMH